MLLDALLGTGVLGALLRGLDDDRIETLATDDSDAGGVSRTAISVTPSVAAYNFTQAEVRKGAAAVWAVRKEAARVRTNKLVDVVFRHFDGKLEILAAAGDAGDAARKAARQALAADHGPGLLEYSLPEVQSAAALLLNETCDDSKLEHVHEYSVAHGFISNSEDDNLSLEVAEGGDVVVMMHPQGMTKGTLRATYSKAQIHELCTWVLRRL